MIRQSVAIKDDLKPLAAHDDFSQKGRLRKVARMVKLPAAGASRPLVYLLHKAAEIGTWRQSD